ncbi:unnamed protein product [Lupinus luteus]|uniref:Uncharacterized protein n=1 Tax=Lupinus luteus TaxID=3873 RepID=A0AAV1W7C3_LUPLU
MAVGGRAWPVDGGTQPWFKHDLVGFKLLNDPLLAKINSRKFINRKQHRRFQCFYSTNKSITGVEFFFFYILTLINRQLEWSACGPLGQCNQNCKAKHSDGSGSCELGGSMMLEAVEASKGDPEALRWKFAQHTMLCQKSALMTHNRMQWYAYYSSAFIREE